jgi:hypothetical protein
LELKIIIIKTTLEETSKDSIVLPSTEATKAPPTKNYNQLAKSNPISKF